MAGILPTSSSSAQITTLIETIAGLLADYFVPELKLRRCRSAHQGLMKPQSPRTTRINFHYRP
jgi:hypothetical protein